MEKEEGHMTPNMERGARIIIHEWVKVRAWDKVLIVTSKEYLAEAKAMEKEASGKARSVNTLLVENKGRHVGIFFDDNEAVFDPYTAIIAATEYSLVTTKAAKRAIQRHKKFLSLPLATNDGRSFLEYDFLTMPGYQALYICTNDQGEMYIKRGENSEEVNDYIKTVSTQDDVVEFNNKITVEYNELMVDHPEVLQYISELDSQVSIAVGEKLANQVAGDQNTDTSAEGGDQAADGQDTSAEGTEQPAEEQGPQYVTTTTTVNVRSSDSEQADKLGKVAGGTKLQVLEQRANGWTKVDYEGKEGYIKTEFLQLAESAAGAETIGTVTATTNINVRASASETADRLGVLSGGDSAELVGTEGDWSKIRYNGQIGYVKSEYVQ